MTIIHKYMGVPDKKITTIPKFLYKIGSKSMLKKQQDAGHEGGLHAVKFADVMCSNLFIDASLGCEALGVEPDDIDAAIGDSIRLSLDILDGKAQVIGMKGE